MRRGARAAADGSAAVGHYLAGLAAGALALLLLLALSGCSRPTPPEITYPTRQAGLAVAHATADTTPPSPATTRAALSAAFSPTPTPAGGGALGTPVPPSGLQGVEAGILVLVNEERQGQGLPALVRNPNLDALARQYAASAFADEAYEASDISYLVSNSWWETFEGATPAVTAQTASREVAYCLEQPRLRDSLLRQDAEETGIGAAIVGDTVYYTQVFDLLAALGGDREPVVLHENPAAHDPSWAELTAFLQADDTDGQAYEPDSFVCADFAELLHNRAEQAGIRAAYVSVEFPAGPGHALNAFSVAGTTVYVDAVGGDKVAYLEVGRPFGVIGLGAAQELTYAYFERYAEAVYRCLDEQDAYSAGVMAYDAEVSEYNAAVDAYEQDPTDAEYARLTEWQSRLDAWAAELDRWDADLQAREAELGLDDEYWDPTGSMQDVADPTVTRVYLHW